MTGMVMRRNARGTQVLGRWILSCAATIPLAVGVLLPNWWAIPPDAAHALSVTVTAVVLWWSHLLPLSITALVAVGLLVVTGAAGSFAEAATGFASDTVFFLFAANLLAHAVVQAGLVDRLTRAVGRTGETDARRAFVLVTAVTGCMALLIPSALVRIKVLLPVVERMTRRMGVTGPRFRTAAGLVGALLGPVASISIMTGGGMSIVVARLLEQFHHPVSWLQWFALMSVPNLLIFLAVSAFIWRTYGSVTAVSRTLQRVTRDAAMAPMRWEGPEYVALLALGATLAAWMLSGPAGVPLSLPPIAAVAFLALPQVGLVTARTVEKQRWDEILVVGSALSLSAALGRSGAIQWVADQLFTLFPTRPGPVITYIAVMVFAIAIRQLFLQPSPGIAITLPIVIEVGRRTGVDPLFLAMITAGVMGVVQILPVQSPPSLVCVTEGVFNTKDGLRVAPVLMAASVAAYLFAASIYWPLLRWLHVI